MTGEFRTATEWRKFQSQGWELFGSPVHVGNEGGAWFMFMTRNERNEIATVLLFDSAVNEINAEPLAPNAAQLELTL